MKTNDVTAVEISTDSFETLLTFLKSINENIEAIATTLTETFDESKIHAFGDGLNIVLGILDSVLSLIATIFGSTEFAEGLNVILSGCSKVIGGLSSSIGATSGTAGELTASMEAVGGAANQLGTSIGAASGAAGELTASVEAVGGAASGMSGSIAAASSLSVPQILLIAAAIAAVIGLLIICWDEFKLIFSQIGEWINNSFLNPLKEDFGGAIDWVLNVHIMPLWGTLQDFANSLKEMVMTLWDNYLSPWLKWINDSFVPTLKNQFSFVGDVIASVAAFIIDLFHGIVLFLKGVVDFITGVFAGDAQKAFEGVFQMLIGVVVFLWSILEGLLNVAIDVINLFINSVIQFFNGLGKALNSVGKLFGKEWGWDISGVSFKIPKLADGGYPSIGQMFIAREAGPELVGTIGSRSAVVNNEQIVESVSRGVYDAVRAALGGGTAHGGTTEVKLYLDGKQITAAVEKVQRERGLSLSNRSLVMA